MRLAVALSGGKDSTAMALRLAELCPEATYFCTPTGDELPVMQEHWRRLEGILGASIEQIQPMTLSECIERNHALPSFRLRFCTRQLKILPAIDYLLARMPITLCVGLRADEQERQGLFDPRIPVRFPLREWGWGLSEVRGHLKAQGMTVPTRTDCARCPFQRISDWRLLWERHPLLYLDAEAQEAQYGATFRSPSRDTWPTALKDLRGAFERQTLLPLWQEDEEDEYEGACRICRM